MKKILIGIIICLSLPCIFVSASSVEKELIDANAKEFGIQYSEQIDFNNGLENILIKSEDIAQNALKTILKNIVSILVIMLLTSLLSAFRYKFAAADLGAIVGISALVLGNTTTLFGYGTSAIIQMSDFSKTSLPILAAAVTSLGKSISAVAKYAATVAFSELFVTISENLILPLIYCYIVSIIGYCITDNKSLKYISKFIKWIVTFILISSMLIFTIYLSLSHLIIGSVESSLVKGLKTIISTSVPVVGSIISDASETILSGMSASKNSIGIFGLLVVICYCITPFIYLGLQSIMFKICGIISSINDSKKINELIDGLSDAFTMMLSNVFCAGMIIFMSIMSIILAGST